MPASCRKCVAPDMAPPVLTIRREVYRQRLRGGNERIDGLFGHRPVGIKELALDRTVAAFTFLGHQVDARVRAVALRPLAPQPHLLKTVAQDVRILGQGGFA